MNILLTGGTGFIGRFLARKLVEVGHVVYAPVRSFCELLPDEVQQIVLEKSLQDFQWHQSIDTVIHLAGVAHDKKAVLHDVNMEILQNLVTHSIKNDVRRFVFISSIGVNGNHTKNDAFTELDQVNPVGIYANSKYQCEMALIESAKNNSMDYVIIRPTLVFGPNAPGSFGKLLRIIRFGLPLPFKILHDNKRSMISLENLSEFIELCVNHPSAANEIFVVSDSQPISTFAIFNTLGARTFSLPLVFLKIIFKLFGMQGMYNQLCGDIEVDITKAKVLLGWRPTLSTEDSLRLLRLTVK